MICDVEGCSNEAVAELCNIDLSHDRGLRCKPCLVFDLGLK